MNSNGGLFGDIVQDIEPIQEEPVKPVEKKQGNNFYRIGNWKNTGYEQWGVLSSLIKELRVGNVLQALYWYQVMCHAGERNGRNYVMKRLTIEAAETYWGDSVVNYANSINNFFTNYQYGETCHGFHLICYMGFRGKYQKDVVDYWWNNRLGVLLEPYRWWLQLYYVPGIFEGKFKKIEYPSYALDMHTRAGKTKMNQGGIIDNRWTGTENGRRKSVEIAFRYDLDNLNPHDAYPITHHNDDKYKFPDYDKIPYKYFPKNIKELDEYYAMTDEDFKKFILDVFAEMEKIGVYEPLAF